MRVRYIDGVQGADDGWALHVDMREYAALLLALDEAIDVFDTEGDTSLETPSVTDLVHVLRDMRSTMDTRAEEEESGDMRSTVDPRTPEDREHDSIMKDYAREDGS